MTFYADLHIHSKYSRATAKNLDLENLYCAAQIKGISVIATGDFTHPAWFEEIKNKLEPAEEGLFSLRRDIARPLDERVPPVCRQPVHFILGTEISNIYKKDGKTRKNHNLIFFPDLKTVSRLNQRLDKIGNIISDGRPILGLDSRDLLEIVLEISSQGFLVPAHIWTPWFSLLGSKSGFDEISACFEDLTDHIFAVETGLSSDPTMNRRVSGLDNYTLISNSDAHSPAKLGREANIFNTEMTYPALRQAMQTAHPDAFLGTVEFYPEEGKYHFDGHRKCAFSCHPDQTRELDGICPVCGKPLTLGVLYRVDALADRGPGILPPKARPFYSMIPLDGILAEVFQVGTASKKVILNYAKAISKLGSEFYILQHCSIDEINSMGIPLLAEAIVRMRNHQVIFEPGYDGEFGKVLIFSDQERHQILGQPGLFQIPSGFTRQELKEKEKAEKPDQNPNKIESRDNSEPKLPALPQRLILNNAQQTVVNHGSGNLLIIAGPGTGKTRTITHRIAALIVERDVSPDTIAAVTFTQKAAEEMRSRLEKMCPVNRQLPVVATFHGLCWQLIRAETQSGNPAIVSAAAQKTLMTDARRLVKKDNDTGSLSLDQLQALIAKAKQQMRSPWDDLSDIVAEDHVAFVTAVYVAYQKILSIQNLYDFDDLIFWVVQRLSKDTQWRKKINDRFKYLFIDEFQDINAGQYQLVRLLTNSETEICAIGDPNQSIYGFRGSDWRFFNNIQNDFSPFKIIHLNRNYRSNETVVEAANAVIRQQSTFFKNEQHPISQVRGFGAVSLIETISAKAEAVAIGKTIESMIGGTGFHFLDFGNTDSLSRQDRVFSDFAVLFRTNDQGRLINEVLTSAGIPCQTADHLSFQHHPVVSKLLAVLRLMGDQAGYADLIEYVDLVSPAVSANTVKIFKDWAYAQQMKLWPALETALKFPVPGLNTAEQYRLADLIKRLKTIKAKTTFMSVTERIQFVRTQSPNAFICESEFMQTIEKQAQAFNQDLDRYLASQATQSDTDLYSITAEKVALLTMHAAKGLEFPVVFVAGCEAGLIPHFRDENAVVDLDEECRLLYVAMTRAQEHLFLTWASKRTLYGKTHPQKLSPFLDHLDILKRVKNTVPVPKQKQLSLF